MATHVSTLVYPSRLSGPAYRAHTAHTQNLFALTLPQVLILLSENRRKKLQTGGRGGGGLGLASNRKPPERFRVVSSTFKRKNEYRGPLK
jgi:hypothetical protein